MAGTQKDRKSQIMRLFRIVQSSQQLHANSHFETGLKGVLARANNRLMQDKNIKYLTRNASKQQVSPSQQNESHGINVHIMYVCMYVYHSIPCNDLPFPLPVPLHLQLPAPYLA